MCVTGNDKKAIKHISRRVTLSTNNVTNELEKDSYHKIKEHHVTR